MNLHAPETLPPAETPLVPTPRRERLEHLDVIRGAAVLGILVVNIAYMGLAAPIVEMGGGYSGSERVIDRVAHHGVKVLFEAKFVTTFSLLFGAGLALMSARAERGGRGFAPLYARRLFVLLAFGILHGVFVWFGDILTSYAVLGFIALACHRCRVKTLLITAGILAVLGLALWIAVFQLMDATGDERQSLFELTAERQAMTPEAFKADETRRVVETMRGGTFGEMLALRGKVYAYGLIMVLVFFSARTLAIFMLGMALVKSGRLLGVADHRRLFRSFMLFGFGLGLPVQAFIEWRYEVLAVPYQAGFYVSSILMSLGYVGLFVTWTTADILTALRERVAAVGRMAFTNYLSHSLITTLIFSGFGLFDRYRLPELMLLVAAIYGLQLLWSKPWLERFRYGPFEWLWRTLTYGKLEPMRRSVPAAGQ